MEGILKFGEFSSLPNKTQLVNFSRKNESGYAEAKRELKQKVVKEEKDALTSYKNTDNYGCQVENGQDIM